MFDKQRNSKPGAKPETSPSYETESSPPAVDTSSPSVRRSALIGASIRIKGDVTGDENLVIDGHVEGTIKLASNEVTVGTSGRVSADMTANMIRVDGEVTGDITGHEKVIISKTGKVQGNIVAPRVTLEDGAKFKGSIDMDPSELESGSFSTEKPKAARAVSASLSEISEPSSSSASTGT